MATRSSPSGLRYNKKTKVARFDFRTSTGRRIRQGPISFKQYGAHAYEAALDALAALRAAAEQQENGSSATVIPSPQMTVAAYVKAFWATSIGAKWKASTSQRNNLALNRYILPFFADLPLSKVNTITVSDFASWLSRPLLDADGTLTRKALRAPTINHALRLVRCIFTNAYHREVINRVPKFTLEKETPLKLEMTVSEQRAFLSAFDNFEGFNAHLQRSAGKQVSVPSFNRKDGTHIKAFTRTFSDIPLDRARVLFSWFHSAKFMYVVALETGLRGGDLRSLRWNSVDFERRAIEITQGKTGLPVFIPLTEECYDALNELRTRSLVSREWVFISVRTGRKFSENTFRDYFALAKRLAGITRRLRIHDTRHTFGSNLASEGQDIATIQTLMGHADIKTTQRYARPDEAALRRAVEALNRRKAQSK